MSLSLLFAVSSKSEFAHSKVEKLSIVCDEISIQIHNMACRATSK